MRKGTHLDDAALPELADAMLNAKLVNHWLGSSYTVEDMAEKDWMWFLVFHALRQGIEPEEVDRESVKDGHK